MNETQITEAIKQLKPSGSLDPNGLSKKMIKKLLPSIVTPLTRIARNSLKYKYIPQCLKNVHIVPIPKANKNSAYAKNIRGINLAPIIIKIIEKVVKSQMYEWLENRNFFSKSQHGFRKNRSTITCLIRMVNKIRECMADQSKGIILNMDFSKAFDVVNHGKLINEIRKAGVAGQALLWITEWLKDNTFQCRIDDALSDPRPITSGVRQGSVLGPLLWIIYCNQLLKDLPEDEIFAYADDVQYRHKYNKNGDKRMEELQIVLKICEKWSEEMGVEYSKDKCSMISLGVKDQPTTSVYLDGEEIKFHPKNTTTVLGVKFQGGKLDPFGANRQRTTRDATLAYRQIKTFFRYASFKNIQIVMTAYSRSKICYGAELWNLARYEKNEPGEEYVFKVVSKPPCLATADRLHKRMFEGKKASKSDILKKGFHKAIEMLPTQYCIYLQLQVVFNLLADNLENADIYKCDFLPVNEFHTDRNTRSQDEDLFTKSTNLNALHGELSIMTQHKILVREIIDKYPDILNMKSQKQKIYIKSFLQEMSCRENEVRRLLSVGEYVQKKW